MLHNILLILIILDGLVLGVVVLLQAGQGGGLASLGGGTADLVLGGRQAVTILHKASWVTGGIFLFLALLLSVSSSNGGTAQSGVQQQLRQVPTQQPPPAAPLQTTPPSGNAAPAPVPPPPPAASRPE